jgi:hypothetical protein
MPKQEIGARTEAWMLQSDLLQRAHTTKTNEALFFLKGDTSYANNATFGYFVPGTDLYESFAEPVQFQIVPSPLAPLFRVEYAPLYKGKGKKMDISETEEWQRRRLLVEFSAYHGGTVPYDRSIPVSYTGRADNTSPPAGPFNFSSQLSQVRYVQEGAANGDDIPKAVRDLKFRHTFT